MGFMASLVRDLQRVMRATTAPSASAAATETSGLRRTVVRILSTHSSRVLRSWSVFACNASSAAEMFSPSCRIPVLRCLQGGQ